MDGNGAGRKPGRVLKTAVAVRRRSRWPVGVTLSQVVRQVVTPVSTQPCVCHAFPNNPSESCEHTCSCLASALRFLLQRPEEPGDVSVGHLSGRVRDLLRVVSVSGCQQVQEPLRESGAIDHFLPSQQSVVEHGVPELSVFRPTPV